MIIINNNNSSSSRAFSGMVVVFFFLERSINYQWHPFLFDRERKSCQLKKEEEKNYLFFRISTFFSESHEKKNFATSKTAGGERFLLFWYVCYHVKRKGSVHIELSIWWLKLKIKKYLKLIFFSLWETSKIDKKGFAQKKSQCTYIK